MGKHYDLEYKNYVVKLVVEEGRTSADVAYDLDIPVSTLRKWVRKHKLQNEATKQSATYITPSELEKPKKEHSKEIEKLEIYLIRNLMWMLLIKPGWQTLLMFGRWRAGFT